MRKLVPLPVIMYLLFTELIPRFLIRLPVHVRPADTVRYVLRDPNNNTNNLINTIIYNSILIRIL